MRKNITSVNVEKKSCLPNCGENLFKNPYVTKTGAHFLGADMPLGIGFIGFTMQPFHGFTMLDLLPWVNSLHVSKNRRFIAFNILYLFPST